MSVKGFGWQFSKLYFLSTNVNVFNCFKAQRIRYSRLWIHTQYLLEDQFIVDKKKNKENNQNYPLFISPCKNEVSRQFSLCKLTNMLSVLFRGGTSGSSPTLSGVHISVSSFRLISYGGKQLYKALAEVVTVMVQAINTAVNVWLGCISPGAYGTSQNHYLDDTYQTLGRFKLG